MILALALAAAPPAQHGPWEAYAAPAAPWTKDPLVSSSNPFEKYRIQPYHLVVAFDRGGSTVIDYPNEDRCLRAKEAVDADFRARLARSRADFPGAGGAPFHFEAICIPG